MPTLDMAVSCPNPPANRPSRPTINEVSGKLATFAANLVAIPMNPGIKIRLAVFIGGIIVVSTALVLTAHTAWSRISELQSRLASVQSESFRIGDHFHYAILDLNNSLLRYQLNPQAEEWQYFLTRSEGLNRWIDEQVRRFGERITEQENRLLHQLDEAYDVFLNSALKLKYPPPVAGPVPVEQPTPEAFIRFAEVKMETDKLLNLGIQLANAHRETLSAFVGDSNRSLSYLRWVLFGSLVLLLLSATGLAWVVFRDLISPLRVKLVESRALLERQEKLASLGMLAAGVAHEIRNPLTAIKARLFTQQKILHPGTPEFTDSEVIGQEINRLDRIVKGVLMFARPSDPELITVSAVQPLREVEALLSRQLQQNNIRLRVVDGADDLIRVDPQQIKQVLINLVQNAAEAIGKDGTITLRSRFDNVRLLDRTRAVVVLEVTDTGKGIPPEVEKRLFDPFFTTKDTGTGLGLPIAARIVEKHGGALRYQTRVGRGTTFGVVLPRPSSRRPNPDDD